MAEFDLKTSFGNDLFSAMVRGMTIDEIRSHIEDVFAEADVIEEQARCYIRLRDSLGESE